MRHRVVILASFLAACSNSSTSGSGGPDGGQPVEAGADTGTGGGHDSGTDSGMDAASTYPAFQPAMPQIQKGSVAPIAAPVVVPVYFAGETQQTLLDGTIASWLASADFASSMKEYGVTSATAGKSIVLTETPAAALTDVDVQTWLAGKLDGTHAEFGAVDATTLRSEIFVLYYPAATTIHSGGGNSCAQFAAYNDTVTLTGGAVANFAVIPRCSAQGGGTSAQDLLTTMTTGSIACVATNPTGTQATARGWFGFDAAHGAFDSFSSEVGYACASLGLGGTPSLPSTPSVARIWSNAAAAAYHDPCLPALSDPYVLAVPVAKDTVGSTVGILASVNKPVTVDVQLLSDRPTSPWTVAALAYTDPSIQTSWDRNTGKNGDVLKLTLTGSHAGTAPIAIVSYPGQPSDPRSVWVVNLQVQ